MIVETRYRSIEVIEKPLSDESLILACRRGDPDAWSVLVNRYQRLIYAIPLRAGFDEDQASEVFQQTFVRLLENLDRIRQPECIHAWLVTTARRETLRLMREQTAKVSFTQDATLDNPHKSEGISDDNPLPTETLERLEEQYLIRKAITSMDERCRCLLTLLYYSADAPSYAEIAAAINMPEGSLGPTRARCLEKLRRLLERAGV